MKITSPLILLPGLCLATSIPAWGQVTEDLKLLASDGEQGDALGYQAVGVGGSRVLLGSRADGDLGGAAYLFDRATGQQLQKFLPADAEPLDEFGSSAAIDGDLGLVGAPAEGDEVNFLFDSGSVYVFDLDTGQQLFKLQADAPESFERFGTSVAAAGGIAVVGVPRSNEQGSKSGSVHVFDLSTGLHLFELLASDGGDEWFFGDSVSIDGDRILVGAYGDAGNGKRSGSAYVFDALTGQEIRKLVPADNEALDAFGDAVAIEGNIAVIGAYGDDDQALNAGAAYVFDIDTGTQLFKLFPGDPEDSDFFGTAVAISENRIVVGNERDDDNGNASGSAYIFDAATGAQLAKVLPSDGDVEDYFGISVGMGDGALVVASPFDVDGGVRSGSAYLFELGGSNGVTYCGSDQNPNNASTIAIDTTDASSSSIQVSLSQGPANQFVYLLVGNGNGTVSQPPGAKGDLCVVGGSCLGRYDKDVGQIAADGTFATDIIQALSNPCAGGVTITPGATWNFQYWHRQPMGQPATFSEAISVIFQ